MRMKEFKSYLLKLYDTKIKEREQERGSGVYLAENISFYYTLVGEILLIQKLFNQLGIKYKEYCPYETEEDDDKFNYFGSVGEIGTKK